MQYVHHRDGDIHNNDLDNLEIRTMTALERRYRSFAAALGDTPESYQAARAFVAAHPGDAAAFWPLYDALTTAWLAGSPATPPDQHATPVAYGRWQRFVDYLLSGMPVGQS